jgi:hypothetical protein
MSHTATAPSPIALKGFVLGYMHKNAADDYDPVTDDYVNNREYGTTPQNPKNPDTGGYTHGQNLGRILKGVLPGAAVGGIAAGGGSVLMDSMRNKPIHVKRALLATLLGLPAGAAVQLLYGSARGGNHGPTLGQFGSAAAGTAKNVFGGAKDKTVGAAKKVGDTAKKVGDAGATAGKNIAADVK